MSDLLFNKDLADFMHQVTQQMAAEYRRIEEHAREDPGTAGDNGEENWAELLRRWLPSSYHVKTKGRVLSHTGIAGPQIDVLVLRPSYPPGLLDSNTKLFLAAGVAAAFECKLTLRSHHIAEAVQHSAEIRRTMHYQSTEPTHISQPRLGTPYKELHSPIVYGLLAHSHSWKRPNSSPLRNIDRQLATADEDNITHPREMLDLLCVADLATWTVAKMAWWGSPFYDFSKIPDHERTGIYTLNGPHTQYFAHGPSQNPPNPAFTPIGSALSNLLIRLAYEDPTLRDLAAYFLLSQIGGTGVSSWGRRWSDEIYSPQLRQRFAHPETYPHRANWWDEWRLTF